MDATLFTGRSISIALVVGTGIALLLGYVGESPPGLAVVNGVVAGIGVLAWLPQLDRYRRDRARQRGRRYDEEGRRITIFNWGSRRARRVEGVIGFLLVFPIFFVGEFARPDSATGMQMLWVLSIAAAAGLGYVEGAVDEIDRRETAPAPDSSTDPGS